jgi:hypothetical protein
MATRHRAEELVLVGVVDVSDLARVECDTVYRRNNHWARSNGRVDYKIVHVFLPRNSSHSIARSFEPAVTGLLKQNVLVVEPSQVPCQLLFP